MKNLINLVRILKYLTGTPKGGALQSSTWTSEYISPFGNKKVRPIKELEELIIKSRLREGAKRFDKGFRTLWGIARLHPATALSTDIVDALVAGKNKDFNEYVLNMYASSARGYNAIGRNTTIKPKDQYKYKYKRSRAILGKGLAYGLGTVLAIPDIVDDAVDLYDTVKELSFGGKITDNCVSHSKKYLEGGEFNPPKITLTNEQKELIKTNPEEYYRLMPTLARLNQRDYAKAWYAERFKLDKYKPLLLGNMDKINELLSTDGYVSYDDPKLKNKKFLDNGLPVDAFFSPPSKSNDGKAFWVGKTKAHWWHEGIGHWLGDQIPGLLYKLPTTQLRYTGPFSNDVYEAQINRQNENHAQTWEFRGLNKDMRDSKGNLYIDPNRLLTPGNVQEMLDKGARLPQGWLDTNITPEGIADFHNTFADNGIKKNNNTLLAKLGIKLINKKK